MLQGVPSPTLGTSTGQRPSLLPIVPHLLPAPRLKSRVYSWLSIQTASSCSIHERAILARLAIKAVALVVPARAA